MYENDDFGKDLVKGLKDGLGDKAASMILKEVSYEVTDEGRLGRRQRSTDAGTLIRTMRGFWLCPTIVTVT
jgi:hypothetical protein